MASTAPPIENSPETTAANKRYEGLLAIRTKAMKGKGAWYWAHLEPVLVRNQETNLPKAVKLKCLLCNSVFSASNPSRTASEHLKRGFCPNFSSFLQPETGAISPSPISSALPSACFLLSNHNLLENQGAFTCGSLPSLTLIESGSTKVCDFNGGVVLSSRREDLGALALLKDRVKKLKSPKVSNFTQPLLRKEQIDSAFGLLADWVFEACGSVSFSSLEHPKFRAFLSQVGLPCLLRKDLSGSRLSNKFIEEKSKVEDRIRDSLFFQIACNGWKRDKCCRDGEDILVDFSVNLPNGTSVYHKAVLVGGLVSSKYAEDVMFEAVMGVCGDSGLQRCVGIVSDKYKSKALRNLETRYQWMVNVPCLVQGFLSLIKDFSKHFQLFRSVTANCSKLADFMNNNPQFWSSLQRHNIQEFGYAWLGPTLPTKCDCCADFNTVYVMLGDILNSASALHTVTFDESCKSICVEDPTASEIISMIQSEGFWSELEAVHSLIKLIKEAAQGIKTERPLIGQCLPLWRDFTTKVKNWCSKFNISESIIDRLVEKRFGKNYHPSWSAAFVLDPIYLKRDSNGKYLPQFNYLTPDQEKDVDRLITRMVSRDEAHVALMELMKWRSQGLDPLYAQAVQVKEVDPLTGKAKITNSQIRRLVWETCLSEYKTLGKVVVRLISLHATSCGFNSNWSLAKWVGVNRRSKVGLERAHKMIYIAANAKLEKRDFANEEEKDQQLFSIEDGQVFNEVLED